MIFDNVYNTFVVFISETFDFKEIYFLNGAFVLVPI